MTIGAGIGIANFTFEDGNGFWEWVDLCDNGGVDSIWQSDRIIEKTPNLETMSVMAALAGGSKRLKFGMNVASMALRDPVLMAKPAQPLTCCLTVGSCQPSEWAARSPAILPPQAEILRVVANVLPRGCRS